MSERGRAWRRWRADVRFAHVLRREFRASEWSREYALKRVLLGLPPYDYQRRLSPTVVVMVPILTIEDHDISVHHRARRQRDQNFSFRSDHQCSPRYNPWNGGWARLTRQERRAQISAREAIRHAREY